MQTKTFGKEWASMLWQIMNITGKGYKHHSLRNTGKGEDRRQDKLDVANRGERQDWRTYQQRYQSPNAR